MNEFALVDVDFIREELKKNNKAMDYELLRNVLGSYSALAYVARNIGASNITPLEDFHTRLAMIGWKVISYRINRKAGDTPRPAALMAHHMDMFYDEYAEKITIITDDRGIIPYLDNCKLITCRINVIGPDAWVSDAQLIQSVHKIEKFSDFINANMVLAGGDWSVDEEFQVK